MKRLTTDNPQDNLEIALNLFYIKNRETWVRGGGAAPDYKDASLYDWIRQIIKTHSLDIDISDNDAMGDCLVDRLLDCTDTLEGVVAHLYTAAWAFSELRARLAAYEDTHLTPEGITKLAQAKADGRLVEMPCKINDTIWEMDKNQIHPYKVIGFRAGQMMGEDIEDVEDIPGEWEIQYAIPGVSCSAPISEIGETLFLSAEAAKAVLEKEATP